MFIAHTHILIKSYSRLPNTHTHNNSLSFNIDYDLAAATLFIVFLFSFCKYVILKSLTPFILVLGFYTFYLVDF